MAVDLLREDARWAIPPAPLWLDGRPAIARLFALYPIDRQGDFRMAPAAANRQPAAAAHLRLTGESEYRLVSLNVMRIDVRDAGGLPGGVKRSATQGGHDAYCAALGGRRSVFVWICEMSRPKIMSTVQSVATRSCFSSRGRRSR